jgi:hypothetical protein
MATLECGGMTPLCCCTTCRAQFVGVDWIVFLNKMAEVQKKKPRHVAQRQSGIMLPHSKEWVFLL